MRIARVIGKVVLARKIPEIPAGALLLVRTCNRGTLVGKNQGNDETLVMFDSMSAHEGDLVGLVEGREATAPFWPVKVPFDAYCACILEQVNFQPILETK